MVIDDCGDCLEETSKPMGCVRRLLMFSLIGGDFLVMLVASVWTLCRSAISDSVSLQYVDQRFQDTLAPHLRRLLTVAYEVGPRKGELLNLEWADVDLRRKEFTLRRTKNGEIRVVAMTPAVYHVFVELWKERKLDSNRVFLYNNKAIQRIGTGFKAACRRAGITNLRIYDFRHTASTNLRRAGVDTAAAMKIVGHKSDRMHRRYNTIESHDLHNAAAKLHAFKINTVITPAAMADGADLVSARQTSVSGRSSVVES